MKRAATQVEGSGAAVTSWNGVVSSGQATKGAVKFPLSNASKLWIDATGS